LIPAIRFPVHPGRVKMPAPWLNAPFRFGVPPPEQLEFFGDEEARALYEEAVCKVKNLGGEKIEIDFFNLPRRRRLALRRSLGGRAPGCNPVFRSRHSNEMNPVVRGIISGGERYTAADVFEAEYRLMDLRRAAAKQWATMDLLVLPTTGTIYTHDQVASDPVKLNTNLGYYTNFVNLMDLAAVAAPPASVRTACHLGFLS